MNSQVRRIRSRLRVSLTVAVFAGVIVTATSTPASVSGNSIGITACMLVIGLLLAVAVPFAHTAARFRKSAGPELTTEPVGAGNNLPVFSPLDGTAIAITDVSDAAFADNNLCHGIAIRPHSGAIFSPYDATVVVVNPTGRSLMLRHANGIEVLIQIGVDTVHVDCANLTLKVRSSQQVKAGDLLVEFQQGVLEAGGYDTTIRVTVLNHDLYPQVVPMASGPISHGEVLFIAIAAGNYFEPHARRG